MKLAKDKGTGYSLVGYFADTASEKNDPLVPHLGRYEDFEGYLDTHNHISKSFAPSLQPINHAFANWSTIATTIC